MTATKGPDIVVALVTFMVDLPTGRVGRPIPTIAREGGRFAADDPLVKAAPRHFAPAGLPDGEYQARKAALVADKAAVNAKLQQKARAHPSGRVPRFEIPNVRIRDLVTRTSKVLVNQRGERIDPDAA